MSRSNKHTFSNLTAVGTKGSDVYTAEGVGDPRVALNTLLVRGATKEQIYPQMDKLWEMAQSDWQAYQDLWVLLFQNRDIRGGKGERATTKLLWEWMLNLPGDRVYIVCKMISLVPEYGCWRDLFEIVDMTNPSHRVRREIIELAVRQLQEDSNAVDFNRSLGDDAESASKRMKVSLLAKWIPRENRQPHIAKIIAMELFPHIQRPSTLMQSYRKMVSSVNSYLKTTETFMCSGNYDQIEPSRVPGRCLQKHMLAFLNEKKDHTLRHPDDEKRLECRTHFQDFFQQAKEGKITVKAKDVVFPHELIKKIAFSGRDMSVDERNGVVAQWNAIVKGAREAGGLGRSLAMCDFSGSMQSSSTNGDTPYWVSMAMGLLISEVTTEEFKDTFLTFDSDPVLHKMGAGDIVDKVNELQYSGIGQGLSTDFQKAMDLVLANIKRNRVRPGQEPENLIVITDMNWDAACSSSQQGYFTRHSYRHAVKTAPWQTHIQMIREAFKRAGEDMWGVPLIPPRIVIWNVAATSADFHAQKDEEGVVMVSGWSPTLFKNLLKGEIRNMTPMEMVRVILDDERYDPVRALLASCFSPEEILEMRGSTTTTALPWTNCL
jgi:hypothetical protein